jgi:hypothetical protein
LSSAVLDATKLDVTSVRRGISIAYNALSATLAVIERDINRPRSSASSWAERPDCARRRAATCV